MKVRRPTEREHERIELALRGADVEQLVLTMAHMSPWIQIDAWVHMEGERKLALWRSTGAVYAVGSDGAVEEDPFVPPAWEDS